MLHFAYSVRMVVGIGIYFRARTLAAGSMCMGHTRRLVGESINRTCDVVATEQVVLHTFRHAPFDVIIESLIDDYTNKADVLSSGKGNVKEDKKEVKKRTKN